MKFGIYTADGTVIRTGECPDAAVELQAKPGEFLYKGAIAKTDRVDPTTGSRIVVTVPEKPGEHYKYDSVSNRWLPDVERAWGAVRYLRNQKIKETDWVVLRASDTGVPVSDAWLMYRQALRDITNQTDPFNIIWPVVPK